MHELLKDVESLLSGSPDLTYIHKAGGVKILTDIDNIDYQMKTPFVLIEDVADSGITHMSSRVVMRTMNVKIHCIQRIFEKTQIVLGSDFNIGVDAIASDVRKVLDMDRMNGKYSKAFWQGDDQASGIGDENIHLVEKTVNFSYVRIET